MSKIEEQENNENVSLDMHDDKSSKKGKKEWKKENYCNFSFNNVCIITGWRVLCL